MESYSVPVNDHDIRPPIQAPMESPLNLAHTFSRKADMMTKSKKYDDAINCHRRAAECLLQAMKSTNSSSMLESMALQHKTYLSQIERLQAKSQLLELVDRTDKTISTVSRATQTDDIHTVGAQPMVSVDEGTVCQILRENDDVIHRHIPQGNEQKQEDLDVITGLSSFEPCSNQASVLLNLETSPGSSLYKSTQRLAIRAEGQHLNDSLSSFEEVVRMNKKLSAAVRGLVQELHSNKQEKQILKQRLQCNSGQEEDDEEEGILKFSSLDLPPLEHSYPELSYSNLDG